MLRLVSGQAPPLIQKEPGMETNLRPMALGEILDLTAQLYRENFLLFAGISAVYAGVLLVLSLVQIGVQELLRVENLTRQLTWATGIGILVLWGAIFIFGGLAVAANNRAVALGPSWRTGHNSRCVFQYSAPARTLSVADDDYGFQGLAALRGVVRGLHRLCSCLYPP